MFVRASKLEAWPNSGMQEYGTRKKLKSTGDCAEKNLS